MSSEKIEDFFEQVITVRLSPERDRINIIDQTLLPCEIKRIDLRTKEEMWEAIKKLRVRGAPAIGVCAALGLAVLANGISSEDYEVFFAEFKLLKDYLASSRPTAVNLFWALNRMEKVVLNSKGIPVAQIKELLFEEALAIQDEDIKISRGIGPPRSYEDHPDGIGPAVRHPQPENA